MRPGHTESERIFRYYRSADKYAERLDAHQESAYSEYTDFVMRFVKPPGRVLDLGCGTGISTMLISRQGYRAVGVDISGFCIGRASKRKDRNMECVCANILALPFADNSFDAAGIFLVIEHIPDIPRLLGEMIRVTRKGGRILILSPNLLSPFNIILPLVAGLRKQPAPYLFGIKNIPYSCVLAMRHTWWLLRKKFRRRAVFLYRKPVLENRVDFIADNDAVYLSCPVDFRKYFGRHPRMKMIHYQGYGRAGRVLPDFSTGIYVVAEKITED